MSRQAKSIRIEYKFRLLKRIMSQNVENVIVTQPIICGSGLRTWSNLDRLGLNASFIIISSIC